MSKNKSNPINLKVAGTVNKKTTIPKSYKRRIDALKRAVKERDRQEEVEFAAIAKQLGFKPNTEEEGRLFDYVFNNINWINWKDV